jgi:hypothetical protein
VSGTAEVGEWPEDWLRLNAVCPYYTMFPLDFPLGQLKLAMIANSGLWTE